MSCHSIPIKLFAKVFSVEGLHVIRTNISNFMFAPLFSVIAVYMFSPSLLFTHLSVELKAG